VRDLPDGLEVYGATSSFDQDSVPAGLTRSHATKPGVWGRIVVEHGELLYRILASGEEHRLSKDQPGIVEPQVRHEVAVVGPVQFRVEFLRFAHPSPPRAPRGSRK
jgi:tellurite resistance-related uncharacterized protein